MNKNELRKISRKLSYVLRHKPESIGVGLDEQGWVSVDYFILALSASGTPIDRSLLDEVVGGNDKNRFELSNDGEYIRARQGHSVPVNLGYERTVPPATLYHGTARQFVDSILETGLQKQRRHHVHMSEDIVLMRDVGSRRGEPVILAIDARTMHEAGHVFYLSGNNVWLTDRVPPQYIRAYEE